MITDPIAIALRVARVFRALGIPHMVVGSLASSLHGEGRTTMDIDFVADMNLDSVEGFLDGLRGEFYADEHAIRDAIRRRSSFNVIHLDGMTKVDVFVRPRTGIHIEELARRREVAVGGDPERRLFFASPEDTILQKLRWYRQGGEVSDRQWRDVLGVLKLKREDLDRAYLSRWAQSMDLEDLLSRALREAGIEAG